MNAWLHQNLRWLATTLLAIGVALGATFVNGQGPGPDSATTLHARYEALRDRLDHSPFQRPLHLDSRQKPGALAGDVYAVVDHSFASVDAAVTGPQAWCDILIVHLNVKYCRASSNDATAKLTTYVGTKRVQSLESAHRVDFTYRVVAASADYINVQLAAAAGPLGTRDYRIVLQAVPVNAGHTFIHLSYSYGYGHVASLAMQSYLATIASDKVGFTVVDRRTGGAPLLVGDVRGAVERNTMRYFLAIDAHLGAATVPPRDRVEKRLRDWFAATERYPLQLRELPQNEYLAMKLSELRRQEVER